MGCHASTAATQPTPPTPNGRHGGLKTGSATPAVWAAPPPGTDGAERHRHRWPGGEGGGQRRHERPTGSVKTGRKGTQNGLFGNAKQAGREYETARPALPELTIRTWQDGEMNHWGARPGKQVRRLAARRDDGAKPASHDFEMHWCQGHCAAMWPGAGHEAHLGLLVAARGTAAGRTGGAATAVSPPFAVSAGAAGSLSMSDLTNEPFELDTV